MDPPLGVSAVSFSTISIKMHWEVCIWDLQIAIENKGQKYWWYWSLSYYTYRNLEVCIMAYENQTSLKATPIPIYGTLTVLFLTDTPLFLFLLLWKRGSSTHPNFHPFNLVVNLGVFYLEIEIVYIVISFFFF